MIFYKTNMVLGQQVGARHKTSKKVTIINNNKHVINTTFLVAVF